MAMASTNISGGSINTNSRAMVQGPSLRNPLPLSSAQEAQVKDLYYKKVRSQCADEIKEFAACARGRTVTASFYCRPQRFAMNSCMILHATQENEDLAREEWFTSIETRKQKKQEEYQATEKRRAEVIKMTKKQEEKEKLIQEAAEKRVKEAVEGKEQQKKGWWG